MLTDIAFVTSGRMKQLKRAVGSYADYCDIFGIRCDFTVFDDGPTLIGQKRCKEWLEYFGKQRKLQIRYAGRLEKQQYAKHLTRVGLRSEVINFALRGQAQTTKSPGRNRNSQLIHFAGSRFFSSDDDSYCCATDFRSGEESVGILSRGSLSIDTHFFDNREATRRAAPAEHCDILNAHSIYLGSEHQISGGFVLPPLSDPVSSYPSRVLITVSGVAGDSGIPDALGFLLADGAVRERFIAHLNRRRQSEGVSRNVVRSVCRPSLSSTAVVFTTTGTGLDNRDLLPPFLPIGLGEDTLFGAILPICIRGALSAHIPIALRHDPSRERTYGPLQVTPKLPHVLSQILQRVELEANLSTIQRLRQLGSHLSFLGHSDSHCLGSLVYEIERTVLEHWIRTAENQLEIYGREPSVWAKILLNWTECLYKGLQFGNSDIDSHRLQAFRRMLVAYGALISEWPDVIEQSKRLRDQECTLAIPVDA